MAGLNLSERVLSELGNVIGEVERSLTRRELLTCFTAAVSVILVIVAGLLILIAELHAGWVPGHELPMDKATAIHNLLFRP